MYMFGYQLGKRALCGRYAVELAIHSGIIGMQKIRDEENTTEWEW